MSAALFILLWFFFRHPVDYGTKWIVTNDPSSTFRRKARSIYGRA